MENLFASRLISARKMAGMSLQDLADKLGNVVTKQSLSKYEQGQMKPDSDFLIQIAKALHVTVDYFFRDTKIKLEGIEFRKKVKLSKVEEEIIKEKTIDYLERYFELERLLNLDPSFKQPIKNRQIQGLEDIEIAAEELREEWALGLDPIPNIIKMLEDKHIKVFEIEASLDFDGFSAFISGKIPVIVVNKSFDTVRRRFTALHELAHLILNFDAINDEKEKEKLCHAFAGAFLIPRKSFIEKFNFQRTHISLEELVFVKEYYGISIQAIMARAKNLNVINDYYYKNFNIQFNVRGYKKNEPGNYQGEEKSSRFQQLLYRAAAEEVISLSKAAALINISLSEFRKTFIVL